MAGFTRPYRMEDKKMDRYGLIPRPRERREEPGSFKLTENTEIIYRDSSLEPIAHYLRNQLETETSLKLRVTGPASGPRKGHGASSIILLSLDSTKDGTAGNPYKKSEAYTLKVSANEVSIVGSDRAGVFYGCQSLIQLAGTVTGGFARLAHFAGFFTRKERTIPAVTIRDYPEVSWRGMMLDIARHFFPKEYILKFIDILALHKLNRLHLHLTDDQGWRIQIDSYPRLTEVGSWRTERGERYGGFLSKDDIKEIVDYAGSRFIEVIPEIDMPGHVQAALAAYPELSCDWCDNKEYRVKEDYGISEEVFCVGQEETYRFVEGILKEVAELFPSPYMHIGGDECPTVQWEKCSVCNAKLRELGLKSYRGLQGYFEKRVSDIVTGLGKIPVAWDEVGELEGLKDIIVMYWRREKPLQDLLKKSLLKKGLSIIIADNGYFYFDYPQSQVELRLAGVKLDFHIPNTPTKKTYSYDYDSLSESERKLILGMQGQIWTEFVENVERLEYMVLPRLCALAEVCWLPESLREWPSFKKRMKLHGKRLSRRGIGYNRHVSFWEAKVE